jgi:hypothetical protein
MNFWFHGNKKCLYAAKLLYSLLILLDQYFLNTENAYSHLIDF